MRATVSAVGQLADLGEHRLGVLVTGPHALEVEDAEAAELADADRRRGARRPSPSAPR